MTHRPPPSKKQTPESFEISIDGDLLTAAIAAVEKRMGKSKEEPSDLERALADDITVETGEESDEESDEEIDEEFEVELEVELDPAQDPPTPASSDADLEAFLTGDQVEPDDDFGLDPEESAWLRDQLQTTLADLEKQKNRSQKMERRLRKAIKEQRRSDANVKRLQNANERALRAAEDAYEAREAAERQAEHSSSLVQHLRREAQSLKTARERDKNQRDLSESGSTIEALLPILDHLEMATSHLDADPAQIIAGIRMIVHQFQNTLERLGVESIESSPGVPFSPKLHEAMSHIVTDEFPPGTITKMMLAGYSFKGRLLRAARVSVAASANSPDGKSHEE